MIRILVVLAVVALAWYMFAGGADKKGKPLKPEEQYQQQEQKVEQMEQQLHQQAREQMQEIDRATEPQEPPAE